MPYTPEHKARTRARIVESARTLFNRHGFASVSIDRIMAGAGLTRSGFYAHFATKEALYAETVLHILDHPWTSRNGIEINPKSPPEVLARQMLDVYLSREHAEEVDGQCPMIALPSDVGREGDRVRAAYAKLVRSMSGTFAAAIPAGERDAQPGSRTYRAVCRRHGAGPDDPRARIRGRSAASRALARDRD